jgi:heat shock 70kDa protein 1/2/6/8
MQIVLIYDLGGGTFDVSIMKITNGSTFDVKAVAGDNHLGGEDFDSCLVDHFAKEFKRQSGRDLKGNPRSLRRLRTACERAKRTLSSDTQASIELECLYEGIDFCHSITRARFELLCKDLFTSTLKPVEQALNDAKLNKSHIDEVIMVGGSTRIPKIQQLVGEFFNQKKLNNTINPDEAVAYGAAVQAATLKGVDCCEVQNVKLFDVVPLSLGTRIANGDMVTIIKRNSRIPCEFTKEFFPEFDFQTSVKFNIHEGENHKAVDNNLLGTFTITGLTPGRADDTNIDVTFILNADGILTAKAKERSKNNSKEIKINVKNGRLTKNDVDRMLRESMKYCAIDDNQKEKLAARNEIIDYIEQLESAIANYDSSRLLSRVDKQRIQMKCSQLMQWLDSNRKWEKKTLENRLYDFKRFIDTFAWNFNKNKLV